MNYEIKQKQIPVNFSGSKKIIVIDPGHGGKDPGAIANGLREKDVNLKIAKKLKKILEKDPRFKVYLTRNSDRFVDLYNRTVFAVKKNADLFIRGARSKIARLVEKRENRAVINYVRVSTNPVVNRIMADLAISTTMTEGRSFAYYLRKHLKSSYRSSVSNRSC